MDTQLAGSNREPAIWARLMQTAEGELSPERPGTCSQSDSVKATSLVWGNWLNGQNLVS